MKDTPITAAILVAAGTGSRAGGDLPKQFQFLNGQPILRHSYLAMLDHPAITRIYIAIGEGQLPLAEQCLDGLPLPHFVTGGATRRQSVFNALKHAGLDEAPDYVLIHDAARPKLPRKIIDDLLTALEKNTGAVPAMPVVDSLARGDIIMGETVDRNGLWRIQTPQAFHFDAIYDAHCNWDESVEATDDARMAMAGGHNVALIAGDEALSKITFAHDLVQEQNMNMPLYRTGTGFDVHKLVKGEELWLCGLKIDHHSGLSGHSDADVALHALTDAILGALALGDIGDHFPPSDPKWRGASSDQFVRHAMQLASGKGYQLGNVDITIICEEPKLGAMKLIMRRKLAEILDVDIDLVSVKATTTERLGYTGRKEGIAAQAIAGFYKKQY